METTGGSEEKSPEKNPLSPGDFSPPTRRPSHRVRNDRGPVFFISV